MRRRYWDITAARSFDILSALIFLQNLQAEAEGRENLVWYLKVTFGNMWKVLGSSCRDACCHLGGASLINGLLSELNGCSAAQMRWGAASEWKVTSCVWISQHPWPLEGSAAEWAHYCPLIGQRSLSASKSALEHKRQTVKEQYGGDTHHPSSRWWCSWCWCSVSFQNHSVLSSEAP